MMALLLVDAKVAATVAELAGYQAAMMVVR